jgi:aminoglycoside 3-N-acetyltransferase
VLADQGGWILLIGVDQTSNSTIHYGEKLAGRKDFIRWSLTDRGVLEFPGYPGCSNGFNQITPVIQGVTRRIVLGNATVLAIPAGYIIDVTRALILSDPEALLCDRTDCLCCESVRRDARAEVNGVYARKVD